jgi:hypothetical protein
MTWRNATVEKKKEPDDAGMPQLTLRFRDVFDVRAAIRLGSAIRALPARTRIVLDFGRVTNLDGGAFAALVPALASLRGYQIRTEGLRAAEQAFLEHLGVPPVSAEETAGWASIPA